MSTSEEKAKHIIVDGPDLCTLVVSMTTGRAYTFTLTTSGGGEEETNVEVQAVVLGMAVAYPDQRFEEGPVNEHWLLRLEFRTGPLQNTIHTYPYNSTTHYGCRSEDSKTPHHGKGRSTKV